MIKKENTFDVIVVGAGHAGCEAALAAARLGMNTLLLTIKIEAVARMSCNPAIGGLAKGHLVREIDALGGEMGRVSDLSGMQFRILNRRNGPAVWGPRSQNDRLLYSLEMRWAIENQPNLELQEAEVEDILVKDQRICGIVTKNQMEYGAQAVILATGTFLNGTIHIGDVHYPGGRDGEPAANVFRDFFQCHNIEFGRMKTGTPPRLDLRTIDLHQGEIQYGDPDPQNFSHFRDIELNNSAVCYLFRTNEATHEVIRKNMRRSALFAGNITGVGPRYCPSIEDKVHRFSDKDSHQIFVEPEGAKTYETYINGISSSLPAEVQQDFVHSIKGFESVRFLRYAYAIEYDFVDPTQLRHTLECKTIKGLYLAGQINGTSGYEEAAAQGLIAAINAAHQIQGKEPFTLNRSQAYIGVLIDDLVTKGTQEPYRMFTSRAEYRLVLRYDNADERLMPLGRELGLVNDEIWALFNEKMQWKEKTIHFLQTNKVNLPQEKVQKIPYYDYVRRPHTKLAEVPDIPCFRKEALESLETEIKYEGYLKRMEDEIEKFKELERKRIPESFDYQAVKGLTNEAREKLQKIQPESIGQASRISGVSPADISILLVYLKGKATKA